MRRINRVINYTRASIVTASAKQLLSYEDKLFPLPSQHYAQKSATRFLDIYKLGSKQEIEKERARLADEMNRGYFADINELKQHGGKIAMANKTIIPAMVAVRFPSLEVSYSDGRTLKLPICPIGDVVNTINTDKSTIPKASLLCLTFRANSQAMVDSWSVPFFEAFRNSKNVCLYEVSFIDSWFLSLRPLKRMLLKIMRKSNDGGECVLRRQIVYSFGDHYYFRKELKILNLLTGYIFLLDKFGRIRWQGFGTTTPEELSSLLSCTSLLLEEE